MLVNMNLTQLLRAVIYDRASLDADGLRKSVTRQHDENLRLCDYKRYKVVASHEDNSISAYGEKERPGFEAVLEMIRNREVDVVVAWHLDRLTRNMADLERLILLCEEFDVAVVTATGDMDLTTDTGRMVARILAAVARQEVERKAARQRLAHAQRRAEGRPWKSVKILGYDREGNVIGAEANAICQAMQAVLEGDATLASIGRSWAEQGFVSSAHLRVDPDGEPDAEGKRPLKQKDMKQTWSSRGVKMVLTNPRIAGYITSSSTAKGKRADRVIIGKGNWEPLVDETTFTLVAAKLGDPGRFSGGQRAGRTPLNLLTGIMQGAVCGCAVRAGAQRGLSTYTCNHLVVPRDEADELVRSAVAAALALGAPQGSAIPRVDTEAASKEIDALRSRQGVLTRSFGRGVTPEADYEAAMADIQEQIEALGAKMQRGTEELDWGRIRAESVRHFLQQPMGEQRAVLERACEVRLHPGSRWITTKDRLEVWAKAKRGGKEVRIPALEPLRRGMQKSPHSAGE